jgi:hypothetical protein
MSESRTSSASRAWLPILAIWILLALVSLSQSVLLRGLEQEEIALWRQAAVSAATWLYWAPLTPAIAALGRRFPLAGPGWPRRLPVHLVAATAAALLHGVVMAATVRLVWPPMGAERPLLVVAQQYVLSRVQYELLVYGAIAAAAYGVDLYRRWREREVAAARLEAQLAGAQLQALRMQLHPHFLFNTLHAISVLIREDPAAAVRTVTLLGDLLRQTLASADAHEIPLRRELELLRLYLEIERTRFPDRLAVAIDVPDELLDVRVPHFILQPLVENAVRYGIARHAGPGRIEIRAARRGDAVAIEVWNDGSALPAPRMRDGIGLATTRGRLERLYGARGAFELAEQASGVVARLLVPGLRAAAPDPAPAAAGG